MKSLGSVSREADRHYALRIERRLHAPREEVWAALTQRDSLEGWLGRVRCEPAIGTPLTIDFGGGAAIRGRVVVVEPPAVFSFTWSETQEEDDASLVRFELTDEGPTTRLVLIHTHQPAAMARRTCAGWHAHRDLLLGFLDGQSPDWEAVYPAAQRAYAAVVEAIADRSNSALEGANRND